MDFEKLFDGMELADVGRKSFYELDSRRVNPGFEQAITEAYEEYEKGDAQFGEYIAVFAEREKVAVEELNLYLYLLMCEKSLEVCREKGIDSGIFYDTIRDFSMKCRESLEKNGVYGIPQRIYRRWFRRYLGREIFRLGRLQFQIAGSIYDTEIDGIKISKGDKVLSVHIPGGEKLCEEACESSYERAREFFKKHFDMQTPVFFCYSWLVQPWLAEVLPESSLIVRFQSKYKIIDFVNDPGDMLLWVFPEKCENPQDYPENTALQKATKKRLLRGEIIGYGSGVRL